VGGIAIYTFMVTPIIFRNFDKTMAGSIVGYMFPYYFNYLLILSVVAFALYLALNHSSIRWVYLLSIALLVVSIILNIISTFVIHPKVKAIKQEIHAVQLMPEDHPARQSFRKLHGISMAINLLVFLDGLMLVVLSQLWKPSG
jgi:hypothetical protein